jgi:hypothetical protein
VDTRDTGGGANVEGDVRAGGDFTGRDYETIRAQVIREIKEQNAQEIKELNAKQSSTMNFNNQDNMQIWVKILEMSNEISALAAKLDDLPNRVGRLEGLQVVVKAAPAQAQPYEGERTELKDYSLKTVFTVLTIILLLILGLVIFLVFTQGKHL